MQVIGVFVFIAPAMICVSQPGGKVAGSRGKRAVPGSEPISAEGEEIEVRQFNFELAINDLICRRNGLSQCSL